MIKKVNTGVRLKSTLNSIAIGCTAATLLLGCSGIGPKHKAYDQDMHTGNYIKAAHEAEEAKDKEAEIDDAHLLATLKAGNGYLYAKDYKHSIDMLDESEDIIKFHREQILAGSAGDYLAQILLSDSAVDYKGTITDAIMVNTYKSIDYMIMGDSAKARVELNRAVDRQRRAKETYAELIGKQKDAIAEGEKGKNGSATNKTLNNPSLNKTVNSSYSNLSAFKAYPDFVNPFTTYLAGLFFALDGDYTKSDDLLKEAYGMMPENSVVASDFAMVENALSGKPIKNNYVWVIYENGLGPIKREFKVNIPVFLLTNDLIYTGIALPKIYPGKQATANLEVYNNNKKLASTQMVADLDRVIMTEFKYSYNDIVTRAVLSAITKTYIQYEAKQVDPYLGLAAAIFQAASTGADTRMWSSLPKDFQVARVEMPEDRVLKLHAGTHTIDVKLGKNAKNSIVYVRIPTAMSMPSYSVANF